MIKNKKFFLLSLVAFLILPIISFAQNTTPVKTCAVNVRDIGDVICKFGEILDSIIPILVLLGVVYFVWGVITYMIGADEEQKEKGKNKIIYGIIGFVVIVSLWGIVTLVIDGFGLDQQESLLINPTNIIDTNLQVSNSGSCYANYVAVKPKLTDLINYVTCVIGASVVPLIFILAVAFFVWGVVQYVINADSEEAKSKGRDFMIWGIIALTVMVSIWGLVRIFGNTFNIDTTFVPQVKEK